MKKFIAEFIGTFILVLFACGTAVIAGAQVGVLVAGRMSNSNFVVDVIAQCG